MSNAQRKIQYIDPPYVARYSTTSLSGGDSLDEAASSTPNTLDKQYEEGSNDFMSSLLGTLEEANEPNWDGDGAQAIADSTKLNAFYVANSIRKINKNPLPDVEPDNEGNVEFEWFYEERSFSIYVTDTNLIYFAGYYRDKDRVSGKFIYDGYIPDRIKGLIRAVYDESS